MPRTYEKGRLVTSVLVGQEPDSTIGDLTYEIREQWHYSGCN